VARLRTPVGIVGPKPAGPLLAHLLHMSGLDSDVVESRRREYVSFACDQGVPAN